MKIYSSKILFKFSGIDGSTIKHEMRKRGTWGPCNNVFKNPENLVL